MIGIYRIYNRKSGKSYVGQSVNIQKRISAHFKWKEDTYIHRAISKDHDAFVWEILEICLEENLDARECHWIATLDCFAPKGYNLTFGGEGNRHSTETRNKISKALTGKKKSAEHVRKVSEAKKGKKLSAEHCEQMSKAFSGKGNPFYGKKHSQEVRNQTAERNRQREVSSETRQKMSESRKGKRHTAEMREKLSDERKGKQNPFYGKKHTPETRAKMSKKLKGRKLSAEHRRKIGESRRKRNHNKSQLTLF